MANTVLDGPSGEVAGDDVASELGWSVRSISEKSFCEDRILKYSSR